MSYTDRIINTFLCVSAPLEIRVFPGEGQAWGMDGRWSGAWWTLQLTPADPLPSEPHSTCSVTPKWPRWTPSGSWALSSCSAWLMRDFRRSWENGKEQDWITYYPSLSCAGLLQTDHSYHQRQYFLPGSLLIPCALWVPGTHLSSYTSGQGLPAAFSPCQPKRTVSNALALLWYAHHLIIISILV